MLSRGLPQVNFQFKNDNAFEQLLRLVKEHMPVGLTTDKEAEQLQMKEENECNQTYAFQVSDCQIIDLY